MSANTVPKQVGRPSFQIDPDRLRGIRQECRLTQQQVIDRARAHLGRPAEDTAVKHYQRIERTGKTSSAMAGALATVLGTTVAVLQGAAPEDASDQYLDRLERQLAEQMAEQANALLGDYLERNGEASLRELAVDIAERVEAAMLDMRAEELEELASLTGWSVEQLMQPVVVHGHWLLSSSPGGAVAEVVRGARDVVWHIEQEAGRYASIHESDTSISLREALPKLHVQIQHPRVAALRQRFSFVRCLPTPTGLQWINPSWRDRFQLDDGLRRWAFSKANFVACFDGVMRPSDVRHLRLKVDEWDPQSQSWNQVALIKGQLDELPENVLHSFQREGSSHDLALNWIASSGVDEIKALLEAWPLECWALCANWSSIRIDLNPPTRLALERGDQVGPQYLVYLAEEMSDGTLLPAPWRSSSVAAFCDALKKAMGMSAG